MLDNTDTNRTLPAMTAMLRTEVVPEELALTLVFHPDTHRIGQRAVVPKCSATAPWVMGRCSPDFGQGEEHGAAPLLDLHISRRALQFDYSGGQLLLHRLQGASRCRVAGSELYDFTSLGQDELRAGVPLLLGHSIVLLLRLVKVGLPAIVKPVADDFLRGSSPCMQGLREHLATVAASDLDVLIRGETGTGKELAATAIHRASRRNTGPLVNVNMSAIPRELAPAALFGSARGAFTGADRAAPGYFDQAAGGSLFLDEIGDTFAEVQPQLLRALQQREVQSVGGPVRHVDVRVIAATDADIDSHDCGFKAALRHRLGACEILMPALREHPEDVGELLLFFLQKSVHEQGRSALLPHAQSRALDIAAWASLFFSFLCYRWPGNVRELANAAQQLVLASTTTPVLTDSLRSTLSGIGDSNVSSQLPPRRRMQDIENDQFDQAMLSSGFEPLGVARLLGVSRTAVYRRIEASGGRYRLANQIPQDELQSALAEHAGSSRAVAAQLRVSLNSLRNRLRQLPLDWH